MKYEYVERIGEDIITFSIEYNGHGEGAYVTDIELNYAYVSTSEYTQEDLWWLVTTGTLIHQDNIPRNTLKKHPRTGPKRGKPFTTFYEGKKDEH